MSNAQCDSILQTTKKLLGVAPSITDFDPDVLSAINASMFTLKQLGVNAKEGVMVYDESTTYQEVFGEDNPDLDISAIKQYIYCCTRLIFDPPQASSLLQALQEQKKELEWRLRLSAEHRKCEFEETVANIQELPNETIQEIWDEVMADPEKMKDPELRHLIEQCLKSRR